MAAGKEIKRLRGNVSAAKAASLMGVDPERLRKWEERNVDPKDVGDVRAVEEYFGCPLKDLVNLESFQFVPKKPENGLKEMGNYIRVGTRLPVGARCND